MFRRSSVLLLLLPVVVLLVGCGSSDSKAGSGRLAVEQATVDRPVSQAQAALRFVIDNGTGTDDTLESVTTDVAGSSTIHESALSGGMATMKARDSVAVPAGSKVTFAPGGLHVMLEDLRRPLEVGDTFDVTLHFARAGSVTVTAKVVSPGAMTDDQEHDHG